MDDETNPAADGVADEIRAFRDGFASVILATVDDAGEPHSSYAPSVVDPMGCFHVFVSALAQHTRNLQANGRAGVLLIESEADAANVFARRRLTWNCRAEVVDREQAQWGQILDVFAARFGALVATLRQLADFQLVRLVPFSGRYVRGFGQAFSLEGPSLEHIHHLGPEDLPPQG
ncbi:MAG: pyridoxamine 5'-phosphate oxidase family protein [Gammaproteobacteria bacterium]|jgi:heme iron utilization protein